MNYLNEVFDIIKNKYGKDVSKVIISFLPNYKKMFDQVMLHYLHAIKSRMDVDTLPDNFLQHSIICCLLLNVNRYSSYPDDRWHFRGNYKYLVCCKGYIEEKFTNRSNEYKKVILDVPLPEGCTTPYYEWKFIPVGHKRISKHDHSKKCDL